MENRITQNRAGVIENVVNIWFDGQKIEFVEMVDKFGYRDTESLCDGIDRPDPEFRDSPNLSIQLCTGHAIALFNALAESLGRVK